MKGQHTLCLRYARLGFGNDLSPGVEKSGSAHKKSM